MGIQRSQEDSWTKEMAKWEQRPVLVGGTYIEPLSHLDGGRAGLPFAEYPKMLYIAESADGGPRIAGFKIAKDDVHERQLIAQGYSDGQERAIARVHARPAVLVRRDRARQRPCRAPDDGG